MDPEREGERPMAVDPDQPAEPEPEIADAGFLFKDAPAGSSEAAPAPGSSAHTAGDGYELHGADEPEQAPRPPVTVPPRAEKPRAARAERMTLDPSQAVEEVWSRWGEWGPSVTLLVAASAFLVVVLYFALAAEAYGLAVFLLFAGGIGCAVLSYPILITLERPVRVTPEQAVKDFYSALSHHMPQYRRMWLLLSRAGHTSSSFASFEGFQNYWRDRLTKLRGDRIPKTVPLKFQVGGFKAAQSAGLSKIAVSYTLEISARGRTAEGPIATHRIETTLVKGPDRMWYLDLGTLPET